MTKEDSMEAVINQYSFFNLGIRKIIEGIRYFRQDEKINGITINGSDINSIVLNDRTLKMIVDVTFTRRTSFELQIHLKKDDFFLCSYANFVKKEVTFFEAGRYVFDYEVQLPEIRSGKYKLDIYFTEPFVTWFANSENDIQVEFINENHHVFLNSPPFNWWGSMILEGEMNYQKSN